MNVNRYKEAITVARDAIGEMDPGDPLRSAAFAEVLRVALSENRTESRGSEKSRADVAVDEASDDLQRIAEYLKISGDAASAVFDLKSGEPRLGIASNRLPEAKGTATQEIALVLSAAYDALDLEPLDTEVVRQVCQQYSRYDKNLGRSLEAMGGRLAVKGPPRSRKKELIIRKPGREEAERVVQRWAGEDDSS